MTAKEDLPEAQYSDTVDIRVSEDSAITIRSELLRAEFATWRHDGLVTGVKVLRDGTNIGITAGTLDESETPNFRSYNGLTPSQARELAEALQEAADTAEQLAEQEPAESAEQRSFLERVAGMVKE